MTSPLRATLVLGMGSLVTLAVGVVTAKSYAVLVGPEGYGLYALLLSVLNLGVLVGGVGAGIGLVRLIAIARSTDDAVAARDARQAARAIALVGSFVTAGVLFAFAAPVADLLAPSSPDNSFIVVAPAILFTVAAGIESATLNGHQLIRALAMTTATSSLAGGLVSIAMVAAMGPAGIPFAVLAASGFSYLIAATVVRRSVPPSARPGARSRIKSEVAAALLRTGASYTTSAIAGTGAQLAVPLFIAIVLTERDVGMYRAAAAISIGYLGFLLQAMGQDYFPRAAAAYEEGPAAVGAMIGHQLELIILLATPLILGGLAAAGLMVKILYAPEFAPAAEILRWQLVGDILKLPAWTLSFIILASGRNNLFLGLEISGGAVLVIATVLATTTLGLTGAGVAYLVTYAAYLPIAWIVVRRRLHVPLSRLFLVPVILAVLAGVVLLAGSRIGDLAEPMQALVFGVGAVIAALFAIRRLKWPGPRLGEGTPA